MKQIRQNVFETNSSSTHSICVAKNATLDIPDSLYFEFGEFGWEHGILQSMEDKASYLYTGLMRTDKEEDFLKIVEILKEKGIEVSYETDFDNGYIDHAYELFNFLEDVVNDTNKLMNYLFSDLSFILTGNDNSDNDVDIHVDYEYDEYYKGN